MHVIVCGAGAIGAATAHFLAQGGAEVTVIERASPACAASGRSGGFLALDWCDGQPLEALARRSFALHAELADAVGGWGYRAVSTFAGVSDAWREGLPPRGGVDAGAWLGDTVELAQWLGTPQTTAQVEPAAFTRGLLAAAEDRGARLVTGTVDGIAFAADGRCTGVMVDGAEHGADAVVLAMGPWTLRAADWLALPPVYGVKGHSLLFDTRGEVPAEALFLQHRDPLGRVETPEIFPRADGTTYVCALSSQSDVPDDPAAVGPDEGAFERLTEIALSISPAFSRERIVARQACYRPVTTDGVPLIGAIPGAPGAFVATGHSVWGILNAPATGEAMADLVLSGKARHVDLAPFDPARFTRRRERRSLRWG
jgi:glycine/D-amino acid oxidase-like deaminating enzyme